MFEAEDEVYLSNSVIRPSHCFRVKFCNDKVVGQVLSKKSNQWTNLITDNNPYTIDTECLQNIGFQPNTLDPFLGKLYIIGLNL